MDVLTTSVTAASGASVTSFVVAPCRLVLLGGYCVCDAELGTIDITVTNTEVSPVTQLTFDLAATSLGDACAATVNNTSIFAEGDIIKIVVPTASADGQVNFVLKYDPFLAGVSGA